MATTPTNTKQKTTTNILTTIYHLPRKSIDILKSTPCGGFICAFIIVSVYLISHFGGTSLTGIGKLQNGISESVPKSNVMSYFTKITEAEPYHNPPKYCNMKVDPFNNHSEIVYINDFPAKWNNVEELIKKRIEPVENIPMCQNSNRTNWNQHSKFLAELSQKYPNLVAYTNRCQINAINRRTRQFGGLLSGDPLKPHHSTQIGFLHVYKAGGTSVRDTMNKILPGQSRLIWHNYPGHLREFMSHLFMFSHVRDPISRTISAFFELHRRKESPAVDNNMVGIDSFRYLLSMMKNRMDCGLANKTKHGKMKLNYIGEIFFNMHIMPQMYFLTEHGNPWKAWPINYVGNVTELIPSTFDILYNMYWNTTDYLEIEGKTEYMTKEKAWNLYQNKYHHGRDRHKPKYIDGGERKAKLSGNDILPFEIEINDLSDNDIRLICEIYWMDYICIPFPIPKACNLTDLLLKHYGDDVIYKDCWEYNTSNWRGSFQKTYRQRHKSNSIRKNKRRHPPAFKALKFKGLKSRIH